MLNKPKWSIVNIQIMRPYSIYTKVLTSINRNKGRFYQLIRNVTIASLKISYKDDF